MAASTIALDTKMGLHSRGARNATLAFVSRRAAAPRWPWHLAGALGISLVVAGVVGTVYAALAGVVWLAFVSGAVSVLGVFVYQGSFTLLVRRERASKNQSLEIAVEPRPGD